MNRGPLDIPPPDVMPVDRDAWAGQLNLSNFINTYYQYRDLQSCGDVRSVLIVGPGQGLDTQVLKWRGYEVITFDIDATFHPDVMGSVHDMHMFPDGRFDAVIASHVLEHLAVPYLDRSLQELARVGNHALVYLPVAGRHVQARILPGFKGIDLTWIVDLYNYFHRPDGVTPRYCGGQHFWEVGMRGFRVGDLVRRMSQWFEVIAAYRNRDWNPSRNFVLKSRRSR
jgi:hypothetical protein